MVAVTLLVGVTLLDPVPVAVGVFVADAVTLTLAVDDDVTLPVWLAVPVSGLCRVCRLPRPSRP